VLALIAFWDEPLLRWPPSAWRCALTIPLRLMCPTLVFVCLLDDAGTAEGALRVSKVGGSMGIIAGGGGRNSQSFRLSLAASSCSLVGACLWLKKAWILPTPLTTLGEWQVKLPLGAGVHVHGTELVPGNRNSTPTVENTANRRATRCRN
jgi:hypothetical protein